MALLKTKTKALEAYAVARDVEKFDLLIEDMNNEFAESWAPLSFEQAMEELNGGQLEALEFVIVGIDRQDEDDLAPVARFIRFAKKLGVAVVLIANDLTPMGLHQLMRLGADDFAPYPLPDGALHESISRLRDSLNDAPKTEKKNRDRHGLILPVYGIAGGVGATTFAVNLAWEMALASRKTNKRVALLDFNFQFGSVSTYLDLARREAIYELISDPSSIDHDTLSQALTSFKSRMAVLTAPSDALPLDIIAPEEIQRLLEIAQSSYDFVVVDMPQTLVHWSDNVLRMCETYFAIMEIDMRSAQNTLRFLRALKAEELPFEKVQFALNRAPGFADMSGKSRVKRLSESLGVDLKILLPDGGKAVTAACDQGLPLAEVVAKNPLRKEIRKIATALLEMAEAAKAAVAQ
jgi:pilus assembly protein CpaE